MIKAWVDGSQGPRGIGIGVVVYRYDKLLFQLALRETGKGTNNVAEYRAFNACLMWLRRKGLQDKPIHIYSDSMMLVGQVNGQMELRRGTYLEEAMKARKLLQDFVKLKVTWIPREKNTEADMLSKI